MKPLIILALCLLPLITFAITRHVSLDGTQTYMSIQMAVNESLTGDTILVHPGRYLENINLSNKNGIILASLEYTTGDSTYISNTIIDGSSNSSSTILCYENTVNSTIRGLSITGGSGYGINNDTNATQVYGGGIFVYLNCNLSLRNLNIHNNMACWGGGLTILASNTVYLSNVNIFNNLSKYRGGGLAIGSNVDYCPNITFDQANRCSIYNNFAQWGMDLDWFFINGGTVDVYLKKFTIPQWEKYFASYYDPDYPPSPYTTFDIQESYLQPVEADLFVSPIGNDNNSGLTPATALVTPSLAMQRIASDPLHPKTVHLLEGVHHNMVHGEYMPISVKDYTILEGVSSSQTRIVAENLIEGTGVLSMGIESSGMTIRDLAITTTNCAAVFAWGVYDCSFQNVVIENCSVKRWLFLLGEYTSTISLDNVRFTNNTSFWSTFGFFITGNIININEVVVQDSQTQSQPANWFEMGCGGFDISVYGILTMTNSKFINNTHYSEEGWANFRVCTWSSLHETLVNIDNCLFAANRSHQGVRDLHFYNINNLNLTNCTFANNDDEYSNFLNLSTDSTRIVNCVFSNNNASYDISTTVDTYIENCLFSKSVNIWRTNTGEPLNWGVNNLTGTDPLFSGTDPALQSSYYLFSDDINGYSPAINAGTMNPAILPLDYTIPQYDAFGFNRVYGPGIDIGCYESQGYTGNEEELSPPVGNLHLANYPNPFNPSTTISYSVPSDGIVALSIFNSRGQIVNTLVQEHKNKGNYQVVWQGKDTSGSSVASGLYFARLISGGKSISHKMLLIK